MQRVKDLCLFAPSGERTRRFLIPPLYFIPPTRVAFNFKKPSEVLACGISEQKSLIADRAIEQRFGHLSFELQGGLELFYRALDLALLHQTRAQVVVRLRAFGCLRRGQME